MKISNDTISILKNFSSINPSIVIRPGSELKTMHPDKTVIAYAQVIEVFDKSAAVYDLPKFIATLSLFQDPEITLKDDRFIIADSKATVTYTYASEEMIVKPKDTPMKLPKADLTFTLRWSDIETLVRASSILKLPELAFESINGAIKITVVDTKNPTADTYAMEVGRDEDADDLKLFMQVENLRLMPGDYEVSLSKAGVSVFKSANLDYRIALSAK